MKSTLFGIGSKFLGKQPLLDVKFLPPFSKKSIFDKYKIEALACSGVQLYLFGIFKAITHIPTVNV